MPGLALLGAVVFAGCGMLAALPQAASAGSLATAADTLGGPSLALLEPPARRDARDTAGSPLDLRSATFGQRGTEMVLRVRTTDAWRPADLSQARGRTLCLWLTAPPATRPRARLCAIAADGGVALRYTTLRATGRVDRVRPLDAAVSQPSARELEAVFTPGAAELALGTFRWQVTSTWRGAAGCVPGTDCIDRLPNRASARGRVRLLTRPRCFGAAARPRRGRCRNPALRRVVFPRPRDALLMPNQFCLEVEKRGELLVCRFQTPPRNEDARTIALIGDSHASHWRAALNVVATAKGWRGVSLTRTGCPFSLAAPRIPRPERIACVAWRREVIRWLRRHPEVRTVFISNHTGGILTPPGADRTAAKIRGYRRAYRSLPRSVRQVVVIRDNPMFTPNTAACVERTARTGRAGSRCALARGRALPLDPSRVAAARLAATSRRYRVIDMTSSFCSRRFCFPVIGGALVNKDTGHLTETYSATLGPVLLRRLGSLR